MPEPTEDQYDADAPLPLFDSEPRRFLTAWITAGQPDTIAVAGGHRLTGSQLHELLADRARMAAELEQVRGEQREEYALCRFGSISDFGLISDDPREQWTGPGANGAAEAAAWGLRATRNANVTVVRRCVTSWRKAASAAETAAPRPADGDDAA
jgi:hypothetical protein